MCKVTDAIRCPRSMFWRDRRTTTCKNFGFCDGHACMAIPFCSEAPRGLRDFWVVVFTRRSRRLLPKFASEARATSSLCIWNFPKRTPGFTLHKTSKNENKDTAVTRPRLIPRGGSSWTFSYDRWQQKWVADPAAKVSFDLHIYSCSHLFYN